MDVSLGIGDDDAVFLELVPDGQHNGTANASDTVGGIVDPETELEVYGVVPEAGNEAADSGSCRALPTDWAASRHSLMATRGSLS